MRLSALLVSVCLGCLSISVEAASVAPQSGTVYVNAGAGFVPIEATTPLAPAAKVMVSPGGSALVTYSDTCAVRLSSGVWSLPAQAPCAAGVALLDFSTRMNQEAPPVTEEGPGTTTLIVGGIVVAGVVTAAIVLSQDGNDKQASP